MERSFNVMDKAAANEGAAGGMMGMGMGLGAGMGVGHQMGTMAAQTLNTGAMPPPLPQAATYYVAVNGQQQGPFEMNAMVSYIQNGQITTDTMVWKQGMPAWAKASSLMDFCNLFGACPPPLPPTL